MRRNTYDMWHRRKWSKKAIFARARRLRACVWSSAMYRPVQALAGRHTGGDPARETYVSCVETLMTCGIGGNGREKAIFARARRLWACVWSSTMNRPVRALAGRHTGEDPARERALRARKSLFRPFFWKKNKFINLNKFPFSPSPGVRPSWATVPSVASEREKKNLKRKNFEL